jgi:histidinol-phosphate phosphatase family protein
MSKSTKFAVFVDRDGTICYDKHYLADPDGLELIDTVAEGIHRLNEEHLPVIVVTNQSGIDRGFFTKKELELVHDRLKKLLSEKGAKFDDIFYCPHLPDEGCDCRKPAPGMLLKAKEKHGMDLSKSFVIGDRMMDIELAHAVRAIGVLVPEPGDQYNVKDEIRKSEHKPDFQARTFSEAVDWVIAKIRENQRPANHPK